MNYAFVTITPEDTRPFPKPIADLMQKLGAQVFVKGYLHRNSAYYIILAEISCFVSDHSIAVQIAEEMNIYLTASNVDVSIPPWMISGSFAGVLGGSDGAALGKKVKVIGQKIHVEEIFPFAPASTIPAIHEYLEAKGCTDIEWSLTSVPYASKSEYL